MDRITVKNVSLATKCYVEQRGSESVTTSGAGSNTGALNDLSDAGQAVNKETTDNDADSHLGEERWSSQSLDKFPQNVDSGSSRASGVSSLEDRYSSLSGSDRSNTGTADSMSAPASVSPGRDGSRNAKSGNR